MIKKIVGVFALMLAGFVLPSGAAAFCSQGFGYDFASSANSSLDNLICFHNDQNDALNSQARTIIENDPLGRHIDDLEFRLQQLE